MITVDNMMNEKKHVKCFAILPVMSIFKYPHNTILTIGWLNITIGFHFKNKG